MQLEEALKKNKIKAILFDFDDTLINSSDHFADKMNQFCLNVSKDSGISYNLIQEQLREVNDRMYEKYFVRKERWINSVEELAKMFDQVHYGDFLDNTSVLMSIFETSPELIDGAMETVEQFYNMESIVIALVTHADKEWTFLKLKETKLDRYFDQSNVFLVNVDEHKSSKHWQEAMNTFGLKPEEIIVIGDSLSGDIISTHNLGVKYKVWCPNPKGWSKYREGQVPSDTYTVRSIAELPELLLKLFS
jgi:FMN phosphatase YigB (HAD superfamily)